MSSETRSAQPRYWCHVCNAEVPIYMAPDPTCQQCNEQFIEELQSDDDPREFLGGADNNNQEEHRGGGMHLPELSSAQFFTYSPSTGRISNLNENGAVMGDDLFQFLTSRNGEGQQRQQAASNENTDNNANPLNNFVQNLLSNVLAQNTDQGTDENRHMFVFGNIADGPTIRLDNLPRSQNNNDTTTNTENTEGENNTNNNNNNTNNPRGNVAGILQFLSAMTGGAIDGGIVGNPNDYVFSQNALDNIITQLMEQTGGGSAPPPAPEAVIDALEHRNLTDEEKSQETDCAVCKDQFEPTEKVIELPCKHIFHDDCIKPWLKLNSTCPVCRHTVLPEGTENNSNENSNTNNNNNNTNPDTNTQGDRSTNNNNNNPATATFTWFGGSGNQQQQQQQQRGQGTPVTIPLNLSATFPWNFARPAENRSSSQPSSTTNNESNSSSNNNNNNNNNNLDDDLDLD